MAASEGRALWILCILSACISSCSGSTFSVTKDSIADAWQSSSFPSTGCFRGSADRIDHWNYFHSGDSPDSSGYQWLLLKLTRGVRVLSVTVHARPAVPERASNTEVWLSDRLPTDFLSRSSSCHGNIKHSNMSGFSYCGRTGGSESGSLQHEVKCRFSDCHHQTRLILLRRFVANQTDKYINFQRVEINNSTNAAQFCACDLDGGKVTKCRPGLQSLWRGSQVVVKVFPPCQLAGLGEGKPTCSLRSSDGKVQPVDAVITEEDHFLLTFRAEARFYGRRLQCSYWCSGGGMRNATDTSGPIGEDALRLLGIHFSGSHLRFRVTTSHGSPVPNARCSAAPESVPEQILRTTNSTTNGFHHWLIALDSKDDAVKISCSVIELRAGFEERQVFSWVVLPVSSASDSQDCPMRIIRVPLLLLGVLLILGVSAAVPITVHLWRRVGPTDAQSRSRSCQQPVEMPLAAVANERDPNTVYYYDTGQQQPKTAGSRPELPTA